MLVVQLCCRFVAITGAPDCCRLVMHGCQMSLVAEAHDVAACTVLYYYRHMQDSQS